MKVSVESCVWYAFTVAIIIARLISRIILFGTPLALEIDDWIMGIFTIPTYTVLIISSSVVKSNLIAPTFNTSNLTPTDRAHRIRGSKLDVVTEQMQIAVVWSCKVCLLILYHRLTCMASPKSNMAIKLLGLYVGLGFAIMEILYFGVWCRPFNQYWAVPPNSRQCNALTSHRITNAVFNISSDIIMLCIALPIFIASLLPLKRKLILCAVFSLGLLVIVAAGLNKYFSFHEPWSGQWVKWYIREASLAVMVANVPFTWTLLGKLFDLGAFDETHPPSIAYHSARSGGGRMTARAHAGGGGTGGSVNGVTKGPHSVEQSRSHGSASASRSRSMRMSGSGSGSGTDRRSLSLIGGMCTPREERDSYMNANALNMSDSRNVLMEQTSIRSHNSFPAPAIIRSRCSDSLDLEERNTGIDHAITPPTHSPTRTRRVTHLSADGTGGFHLTVPRRSPISGLLSEPSAPNARERVLSRGAKDVGANPAVGGSGGRSARDRKMRTSL